MTFLTILCINAPIKLLNQGTIKTDNKLVHVYLLTLAYFDFVNKDNKVYIHISALILTMIKQDYITFDINDFDNNIDIDNDINYIDNSINNDLITYGMYKCNDVSVLVNLFMITVRLDIDEYPLTYIVRFYLRWYKQGKDVADSKLYTFLNLIFIQFQKLNCNNFYNQFLANLNSKDQTNLTKFINHFTTKLNPYFYHFVNKDDKHRLNYF